jgi:homoserine dehydrogenase
MTFRETVEAFLRETGRTPTAFGREVLGDPTFVFELRRGRNPRIDTAERVKGFIDHELRRLRKKGRAA